MQDLFRGVHLRREERGAERGVVLDKQPNVRRKQGRGDGGGQFLDQEVQGCDEVRFLSGESMCVSITADVKESV